MVGVLALVLFFVLEVLALLMVGSLLVFHSYLSSSNLTTWECLAWRKISYMKIWP